ncbi:MAG: RNA chaperone Hfq [Sphingomonas bacterium]|nr:RNA chaperone Hfq [Sphingomonas bacterium]
MPERAMSLQDQFLNAVRKDKTQVTIFLMKGVKLQGVITWFDAFSMLLRRDGTAQLLYKHAVSTIVPTESPKVLPAPVALDPRKSSLQDIFLSAARGQHEPMTLFLVNGVMLQGMVGGYDQFSILLERSGHVQLVYKHAVSTLQPAGSLDLQSHEGEGEQLAGDGS